MIQITTPVPQFYDLDGSPLDDGAIYIGVRGMNPQTHPQAVYWDADGAIPADQPITVINGQPWRDGAVSKFFTTLLGYSITVRNKRGELVYSTLDTTSGVFDELRNPDGAAQIGYDNTASELEAETVQEALDKLKGVSDSLEEKVDSFTAGNSSVINLFSNAAFLLNSRGYVSGTAASTANQESLDGIHIVELGQSLTFEAADFGNRITAPSGGAEQTIPASSVTGGGYAFTWGGPGTIQVNGAPYLKGDTIELPAGVPVVVRMFGEIEKMRLTRPSMLGDFEYSEGLDRSANQQASVVTGVLASGSAVDVLGIPAWAQKVYIGLRNIGMPASQMLLIRCGYESTVQTTNYASLVASVTNNGNMASITDNSVAVRCDVSPAPTLRGSITLTRDSVNGAVWRFEGSAFTDTVPAFIPIVGLVALSRPMSRIRLFPASGSFTGGLFTIHWSR
jgi:hypothetical protein